jgi:hypothetical protein
MNSITNTLANAPTTQLKPDLDGPQKTKNQSNFQAHMDVEVLAPEDSRGCHGYANEIDMEAFFAAWGSTDSHYDVDANGIVDGGDLTILLAGQNPEPTAGSVDDVLSQWGVQGESTADINADGIVDGADLVLALAGPAVEEPAEVPESRDEFETKLEALLADWGTDAARSDLTGDGIVDGLDLSFLLGGRASNGDGQDTNVAGEATALPGLTSEGPTHIIDPLTTFKMDSARIATKDLGARIFDQIQTMGFEKHPPRNLGSLVDAFKLSPMNSKALLTNIAELFGGDDRKDVARG